MSEIKALVLDMDGVLWRADQPIGDLPAIMAAIADKGLAIAYATNNATRTADQFVAKLGSMGVTARPDQIYTSARATVRYLAARHPDGGPVFMVGEDGLQQALEAAGFKISDKEPLAVVVGLDNQATYAKLRAATLLVRAGAPLIGTNPDRTLPTPDGLVPGAGALIAAIEAATDTRATIIGKPQGAMLQDAMDDLGVTPDQTLMVGDRVETDIAAGQVVGCRTALLLSGVTSEAAAQTWQPAPDYIEADLASLIGKL
jgi:4-nitrophenyl phosphatase